MWTAVLTISLIALLAGLVLSYANRSLPSDSNNLVDEVNELLPQTQCAQCGYPGCRPYAAAVVESGIAINLCPPGGDETVQRLASLLLPNNPGRGAMLRSSMKHSASAASIAAVHVPSTPLLAHIN